jgi:hypothetical protein
MRVLALCSGLVVALGTAAAGQVLSLKPPTVQRMAIVGAASAPAIVPGGTVTLWADVTPNAGIHVYASGAKDFTPVTLKMTPRSGVTFAAPSYPASELSPTDGALTPVPVYRRTFRITQPVRVGKSMTSGETLTLAGAVTYQACDERLCYPTASLPVVWHVAVK